MSHTVTFDSPQSITLVAKEEISDISVVEVIRWIESTDESGDYTIHVYIKGSRVPLQNLLAGDQARLKEILDGSDTAANKKVTVVKEAIQAGDYTK